MSVEQQPTAIHSIQPSITEPQAPVPDRAAAVAACWDSIVLAEEDVVPVRCGALLLGLSAAADRGHCALSCMMVSTLLQAVLAISLGVRSRRWSHMAARTCRQQSRPSRH